MDLSQCFFYNYFPVLDFKTVSSRSFSPHSCHHEGLVKSSIHVPYLYMDEWFSLVERQSELGCVLRGIERKCLAGEMRFACVLQARGRRGVWYAEDDESTEGKCCVLLSSRDEEEEVNLLSAETSSNFLRGQSRSSLRLLSA